MCGIAGIVNLAPPEAVPESLLRQMLGMIRHRGPDEFGILLDGCAGLGSARLSIVDLTGGQQPLCNEDKSLWIVFNGEIFNHVELRPELEARGHRFVTNSDTEVLLHAFEEYGTNCLARLNGQFAFAIWNARDRSLFLARDRLGVRPLFYSFHEGHFVFASEIKAILADVRVRAEIAPAALADVFTYWSPLSPDTVFCNILQLPPAHYLVLRDGVPEVKSYWEADFPADTHGSSPHGFADDLEECEAKLSELLIDATRIRLRADVPVGAYLSGGLDSSLIAAMVRKTTRSRLDTFSIAFENPSYDESEWQQRMARYLGTDHQVVRASDEDIGRIFPEVIWHTEVPVTRTAPAPMFLLSKLVRDSGYKVVLTGEGADEFLAGYDIFKENKIRRFWASNPESKWRPALLQRLYPEISSLSRTGPSLLAAFFRDRLAEVDAPDYSHLTRWRNGRRNHRFFSDHVRACLNTSNRSATAALPPGYGRWSPLARAQYLEIRIFMSQYLLSSQGDRVGMAHSIEGRFPFLDPRVVEFANKLAPQLKLRGLTEKYLLRKVARKWLPEEIWHRRKRPYRAPIHKSFFGKNAPDYVVGLLSQECLRGSGLFKPEAVAHLVRKCQQEVPLSENDEMALAGILSTQLVHSQFVSNFRLMQPLCARDKVKVVDVQQPGFGDKPSIVNPD